MKQKIIFSLLVLFLIGCSSSLDSEYFSVSLSSDVGTDSDPLIIAPINTSTVSSLAKYSDKSLSFSVKPESSKIVEYSLLSVIGTNKSELPIEDFIFDVSTKKIGVKQGSKFGPNWGASESEVVTLTIQAKNSKEELSDISVKVLLKATK